MKYTDIKNKHQKRLQLLSDKVGLFWAFNTDQFKKGSIKNPTKNYASIGMGGYLPSINVDKWVQGMKKLDKKYKQEVKQAKKNEAILYELNNYECFYTGDINDASDALKGIYTKQEVKQVYLNYDTKYA